MAALCTKAHLYTRQLAAKRHKMNKMIFLCFLCFLWQRSSYENSLSPASREVELGGCDFG
jgi:hypothetical protein